jgi:hypothetical protein
MQDLAVGVTPLADLMCPKRREGGLPPSRGTGGPYLREPLQELKRQQQQSAAFIAPENVVNGEYAVVANRLPLTQSAT